MNGNFRRLIRNLRRGAERTMLHGTEHYIRLSDAPTTRTEPDETGTVMIDYDAAGGVVGVEILSTGDVEVVE